jgi:hypothetical protein
MPGFMALLLVSGAAYSAGNLRRPEAMGSKGCALGGDFKGAEPLDRLLRRSVVVTGLGPGRAEREHAVGVCLLLFAH